MKSILKLNLKASRCFLRREALLTATIVAVAQTGLLAQPPSDNLASEKNGAVVIYSTPLNQGASPNTLVNGKPGAASYSSKTASAPHLTVIDLSKPYTLDTVNLKFTNSVKVQVYVLQSKPDGNTPWSNLIAGLKPNGILDSSSPGILHGALGEYLAIVSDRDPGKFSNLYVTGSPYFFDKDHGGFNDHDHDHDHNGPPCEPPRFPHVPPCSH